MSKIIRPVIESADPDAYERLCRKSASKLGNPVDSHMVHSIVGREQGIGSPEFNTHVALEWGTYQVYPEAAMQARRVAITERIAKLVCSKRLKIVQSGIMVYLDQPADGIDQEYKKEIASVVAIPARLDYNRKIWVSLTTFYLKEIKRGEEVIARSKVGEPIVAPSLFVTRRPSVITRGTLVGRHFPESSEASWQSFTSLGTGVLETGYTEDDFEHMFTGVDRRLDDMVV